MNYKACDFYVARTPLLPIEDYFRIFESGDPAKISSELFTRFKDPFLEETLAVSSRESYEALHRLEDPGKSRASDQMLSTLLKYYIRLTTRPTPYGLFSGVSLGTFGEENHLVLSDADQHVKRARVDMEWLYAVIQKIESIPAVRMALRVRFNDYVYQQGDRLEKPNKTSLQLNSTDNEVGTTIRYTRQVQAVQELAKEFIVFSELLQEMSKRNPDVPLEVIEAFLNQLLENEFLLSELRPPMVNTDALTYVLNILAHIEGSGEAEDYRNHLATIQSDIARYNTDKIGSGLADFNAITEKMQSLHKSDNCLQVDLRTNTDCNVLSSRLKQELEEFVAAMLRITPEYQVSDEYATYINQFVERYGFSAEVPVLELLDIDCGLGAPSYYGQGAVRRPAPQRQESQKELRLKRVLKSKTMLALKGGQRSFELTDQDIDYIAGNETPDRPDAPEDFLPSFELFLMAHPHKNNETQYAFTVAPVFASNGIGKGLGRFRDMFSEEETAGFREQSKLQKERLSEYVFVETAEVPERGRTSNVAMNESDCDYQLMLSSNSCEGKERISIDDLYVSADPSSRRLVIRSRRLNKKVLLLSSSMLNPSFGSNALRFLKEVSSKYRYDPITAFSSVTSSSDEYSPRITYRHIIVKPETWIVTKDVLDWSDDKEESFLSRFQAFREKWDMPRYVLLTHYDNRLLFDLENSMHLHEIFNIVKRQRSRPITMMEMTCMGEGYAAQDGTDGHYVTEIVVPFMASGNSSIGQPMESGYLPTLSDVRRNAMKIQQQESVLLPGSDNWLYFKLYGNTKRRGELLTLLYEQMESMVQKRQIRKYFFIRYSDPEPHLRVRVQAIQRDDVPQTFGLFMEWFDELRQRGLLSNIVIDTYQRETERYGGPELIGKAEEYFFHDSRTVLNILRKRQVEKLELNPDYIGISFLVMALTAFGLSLDEIENHLNRKAGQNELRKEYQADRKRHMAAANMENSWAAIRSAVEYPHVYDSLEPLERELCTYAQAVDQMDRVGALTNSRLDIVSAVIHMFCNRFVGSNAWERKIYALARHGVHDLVGYLRYRPQTAK